MNGVLRWRLAFLGVLLAAGLAWSQDLLPVPVLEARVIDQTGTLSGPQRASIEARLQALETEKGSQVVVLMVPSTAPEDIASYANRVANAWKIGRRDVGDGVLLVLAKNDRRLRIEVAKTLEGAIPDLAAKRIIDEAITPGLRQGDFAAGIGAGVDRIAGLIRGEALPAPAAVQPRPSGGWDPESLISLMVFIVVALPVLHAILGTLFGRKLGAVLAGVGTGLAASWFGTALWMAVMAALVAFVMALTGFMSRRRALNLGGGWGSGGGGGFGSGGSGGFSSGGGGDFGGGGASGRW